MTTVYNVKDVNVVIDGITVTGFAEDSIVSCSKTSDNINPYVGAQGETAFSINNDPTGTISITLQQQSPMNDTLLNYSNENKVFPISVIDLNTGGFRASGNEAIIQTNPEYSRGNSIGDLTWEILVFDYTNVPS